MKKIEAVIRCGKLESVREALLAVGVEGMTVIEAKGIGRQRGKTEIYRGAEYCIVMVPKVKLETIVDDDQVDDAVDAILHSAHTGNVGDGRIFISDLETVLRIRTGEVEGTLRRKAAPREQSVLLERANALASR